MSKTLKRAAKLSVEIRPFEIGQSFQARWIGRTAMEKEDAETGEVKTMHLAVFEEIDTKTRFGVFENYGLRQAISSAMVKEGEAIEVVRLEKAELKGGRTVNQYDVFALTEV